MDKNWFIYIIRCCDGSLYTGITTDVARRFEEHQRGVGSKYVRSRLPVKLVFKSKIGSHNDALRFERKIKKMSKAAKEQLIKSKFDFKKIVES